MLIQKNASLNRNIYLPPTKSEEEVARQQEAEVEAEAAEASDEETEEEKEKRRRNKLKLTWHWKPAKKIWDEEILSTPIFQVSKLFHIFICVCAAFTLLIFIQINCDLLYLECLRTVAKTDVWRYIKYLIILLLLFTWFRDIETHVKSWNIQLQI